MAKRIGYLKVDGVEFPPSSARNMNYEKIWSANTGRTAKGKMTGSIVANKRKIEDTINYLKEEQVKKISDIMDTTKAFHNIEYYDITKNKNMTMIGYFGDSSYPIYGFDAMGNPCVTGFSFSIIEQ